MKNLVILSLNLALLGTAVGCACGGGGGGRSQCDPLLNDACVCTVPSTGEACDPDVDVPCACELVAGNNGNNGNNGGDPVEGLCLESGGRWDEGSCGHYVCGEQPPCEALIPGCDCGPASNFDPELGCQEDPECANPGDINELLCQDSGGEWLPTSCGDWVCGEPPLCQAIIPGCNCGPGQIFVRGSGCRASDDCETPDPNAALCADSGGTWDPNSCGHYTCGRFPECDAIIPGCDCGPNRNFDPERGCYEDRLCANQGAQTLCEETDGRWDDGSCGHYVCGMRPTCRALIPGCDCLAGRVFDEDLGCVADDECACDEPCFHDRNGICRSPNDGICLITDDERLCVATGGDWDERSCGHYSCGNFPECDAIIPGCNCGPEENFAYGLGCRRDFECLGQCDGAAERLAAELYRRRAQACSAVIRVDHQTLALNSYNILCDNYALVTEQAARDAAQRDTGFGRGTALNDPDPEDAWIFYTSPGDFGGVGVVSPATGLTLFGASIVWDGRGDIIYPRGWRAAQDLGQNCNEGQAPTATGYDLVTGEDLDERTVDRVLGVVLDTAFDEAFWLGGYLFNAVVIRYPRSVGAFDPTSAEFIVLLNGGWLE